MSARLLPSLLLLLPACGSGEPEPKRSPPLGEPPEPTDTGRLPPGPPDSGSPVDTASPEDSGDPSPDGAGDTPETARELPPPEPALQVSDAIEPPGDVDWYAVELEAGDTLWIAVLAELRAPSSPLSPVLEVTAPDATSQVVRGMALDIGGDNAALAYTVHTSGRHLLRVTAADPEGAEAISDPSVGSEAHTYSLRLERAPPFEVEPFNDSQDALMSWLEEDGTYAYFGDPFIAGYPLFSGLADTDSDIDLLPWTVRGELSDGSPADWELWSWSPWPGSSASSTWSVRLHADPSPPLELGRTSSPHTDPLWRRARRDLPLLPDVGLLVASPPGEMWLELDHSGASAQSSYTGVLAGWTTDAIDREQELPRSSDGDRQPRLHAAEDRTVAAIWGTLEDDEVGDRYRIPVDPDRPVLHVFIQARGIGSPLDPALSLTGSSGELAAAAWSPIDGGEDPELLDVDASGQTHVQLRIEGESPTGGPYLLQVHATATARFP